MLLCLIVDGDGDDLEVTVLEGDTSGCGREDGMTSCQCERQEMLGGL